MPYDGELSFGKVDTSSNTHHPFFLSYVSYNQTVTELYVCGQLVLAENTRYTESPCGILFVTVMSYDIIESLILLIEENAASF